MTVQELIEALIGLPRDAEVKTEGCDCNGDIGFVVSYPDDRTGTNMRPCNGTVFLARSDADYAREQGAVPTTTAQFATDLINKLMPKDAA